MATKNKKSQRKVKAIANLGLDAKLCADAKERVEYRAASIFRLPRKVCWQHLKPSVPQGAIGTLIDGTELRSPYEGRVYDLCCGSGARLVDYTVALPS